jgi:hypothetical protein
VPTKRNKNDVAGGLKEEVVQHHPLLEDDPEEGVTKVP